MHMGFGLQVIHKSHKYLSKDMSDTSSDKCLCRTFGRISNTIFNTWIGILCVGKIPFTEILMCDF